MLCLLRTSLIKFLEKLSLLKLHFRYIAVNFLQQNFYTLLFTLTCILTITRRKRPKRGSKTRFQSDFYTFLIICVPPIILGQVLRYFPAVIPIHINSFLTSYDACANANKMAEIEHVKRARVGRPKRLTASVTKRKKSENDAKCNRSRINIDQEFGRRTDLKDLFRLKTHAEVGTILLDR